MIWIRKKTNGLFKQKNKNPKNTDENEKPSWINFQINESDEKKNIRFLIHPQNW